MLRAVAKFALVVSVAAPGFSREIGDQEIQRWAHAGGLETLIAAAWTEGEASERQIVVSDQDVREAMQPPHAHLTRNDRAYEARIALLAAALKAPILQAAAQSVTQQHIDAYVADHPKLAPERRKIRAIRARTTRDAIAIKAAIKRGLTWKAAAHRLRTHLTHGYLDPDDPLQAAASKTPLHALRRHRTTVFEVTSITKPRPLPLAQQQAQAWELLAGDAQQRAATEYAAAIKAKWRPRTTCATPTPTTDLCANSPTG